MKTLLLCDFYTLVLIADEKVLITKVHCTSKITLSKFSVQRGEIVNIFVRLFNIVEWISEKSRLNQLMNCKVC